MPDPRSAMKEFRFLEQKRVAGGLTLDEELRLAELRDLIGPEPAWTARPGFDVNAAAARLRASLGPAGTERAAAFALPFEEEDADALLDAALPGGPDPTASYPVGEPAWSETADLAGGGSVDAGGAYGGAEPGWDPNAFAEPGAPTDPGVPYADAEPSWDPSAFAAPGAPADPGAPYADAEPSWDPSAFAAPDAADPSVPYAVAEPTWDPDAFAAPGAPADPGAPYAGAEPTWDPSAFAAPGGPADHGAAHAGAEPSWDPNALVPPGAPAASSIPYLDAEPSGVASAIPEPAWASGPGGDAGATLDPFAPEEPAPVTRSLLSELTLEDDPAAEPSAAPAPGDAAGLPPEGFDAPAPPLPAAPLPLVLGEYDELASAAGVRAPRLAENALEALEPSPDVPPTAPVLGEYDALASTADVRDAGLADDALEALESPRTDLPTTAPVLGEYDDTSGFEAPAGAFAEGSLAVGEAALGGFAGPGDEGPVPELARTGVLIDPPAEDEASFADLATEAEEPPRDLETERALRLGFALESGSSFGAAADAAVPDWARAPELDEARADDPLELDPHPVASAGGALAGHEPWAIDAPAAGAPGPEAREPVPARADAPSSPPEAEDLALGARAALPDAATAHAPEDATLASPAALQDATPADAGALVRAAPDDSSATDGSAPVVSALGPSAEPVEPTPPELAAALADAPPSGTLELDGVADDELDEILDIDEAGAVLAMDADAPSDRDPLPVPLDVADVRPDALPGAPDGEEDPPPLTTDPAPRAEAPGWAVDPDRGHRLDPAPALAMLVPEGLPPLDLSTLAPAQAEDVALEDLPTLEGDLLEELPSEELVPLPEPLDDAAAAAGVPASPAERGSASAASRDDAATESVSSPAEDTRTGTAPLARATQVPGAHRVVVHTAEGLTLRGVLEDPDLAAATIRLVPSDGGAPEELDAAGLKAIFFMIPPGEPAPPPEGRRVHVTFRDGRRVAGFSPDYADGAPGFFLHPAEARTHTGRIWVYQSAVKQVAVG